MICFNQVQIRPCAIELEYIGWEYFRQAFAVDTEYPTKLISSVCSVAMGTPLVVVFSLVIALLLNGKFRGRTVYRIVFSCRGDHVRPVMSELMSESRHEHHMDTWERSICGTELWDGRMLR